MLKKMILWIITLAWAALIFCFSAQPATQSSDLSLSVTARIVNTLPAVRKLPQAERTDIVQALHGLVRKLAHFSLYLVLGFLLQMLFASYGMSFGRAFWLALAIGALYAASDELHQLFVPGRSGQMTDVLIDGGGICAGSFLRFGYVRLLAGKRKTS